MFRALAQMFAAFFTLFQAAEKGAKAIDHLASWAEESSEGFNLRARLERKAELDRIRAQLAAEASAPVADLPPSAAA